MREIRLLELLNEPWCKFLVDFLIEYLSEMLLLLETRKSQQNVDFLKTRRPIELKRVLQEGWMDSLQIDFV